MKKTFSQIYFQRKPDQVREIIPHSTPYFDENDINAVNETIMSGIIAPGKKTIEFEGKLADYLGVKDCFVTNSGTSSMHLALLALGLKKNDKVLMPSLVCYAVLDAINYIGLTPVFVDVEPGEYNIGVKEIQKKLHFNPKAIIVPHLYGKVVDIESVVNLGIPVIEDCCQSLGGELNGRKSGSIGTISIFSFYATKVIATGTGGAVASNSPALMEKVKEIGTNYYKNDYKIRYNYRMSDLQASLGVSQLSKIDFFLKKRNEIAGLYNKCFQSLNITQPLIISDFSHIFYRYMVRVENNRDDYIRLMKKSGIICEKPDFPLHRYLNLNAKEYPNTEDVYNSTISIPIYPFLNDLEINHIKNNFSLLF